jgi:tripartite-type tricarboxylate transporter receptor subunit TctC
MGALVLAYAASAPAAAENSWPGFAVRLVSMHAQSSIDDPLSRPLAEALKKSSSFQVALQHHLLDAAPSGPELIANSAPNGQTVGVIGNETELQGMRPIALLASSPLVVVTHPGSPYRGVQDVIRAAQRRPGQVLVGSPGPRSPGHLAIEELKSSQSLALVAMAYKGNGPLIVDIVSGRMALGVMPLYAALPHVNAGRIRVIGISSLERDARLPEVRTLADQGLEKFELHSWWGAFAAQKTPEAIANQITTRFIRLGQDRDLAQSMRNRGVDLIAQDNRSLEQAIASDSARWSALQREASLKQEQ